MSDKASKTKGLAWLVGACLLGAGFALGLAPLAHSVPWRWEKKLGALVNGDEKLAECSAQAQGALRQLVARIYPVFPEDSKFSIDARLVKSKTVNAYAALGGRITVFSGLLAQAQSPEELAGVLAHEIEHVRNRHIMQGALAHLLTAQGIGAIFGDASQAANWAGFFLRMDFTRAQEAQADEGALLRLRQAEVDNGGFAAFFERMEKGESGTSFLSDHPSSQSRREMVEGFANGPVRPVMTAEEWAALKGGCK